MESSVTKGDRAQYRRWCFTLNNYTDDQCEAIQNWDGVKYLLVGKETAPTTGTKHLQGYVSFLTPKRFSQITKLLPTAHWEVSKGSDSQNREYCSKGGDLLCEKGTLEQGRRTDLELMRDAIYNGERSTKKTKGSIYCCFEVSCCHEVIVIGHYT